MNYCELARSALATWLHTGKLLSPPERAGWRAGCFVSLHDQQRDLRGCMGTIAPVRDDLSEEIVANAISAGCRDPRFPQVTPEELNALVFEVSVLSPPEDVANPEDLDPDTYGIILTSGSRRGVLLPGLEGVDTVERQMAITRRKAGITPDEPVHIQRFKVVKYGE